MAQKFLSKDAVGLVAKFTLGNGLKIVLDAEELNADIREQLMMHGLLQKVGDAAAGFSKTADYSGAFTAMQQVADNLLNGVWSTRGGGKNADLVLALAELRGIEVEAAQALVDGLDEEKMTKVLAHPQVKAKVAEIRAERAKAAAAGAEDLDDILGEEESD